MWAPKRPLTILAMAWERAVTIVIFRSGVIHVVRPSDRLFRRRLGGVSVYRDGVDATLHIRPGAGKGQSVVHVNILNSRKRWQQRRVAIVTTVSLPSWVQRFLPKERRDVPANS